MHKNLKSNTVTRMLGFIVRALTFSFVVCSDVNI